MIRIHSIETIPHRFEEYFPLFFDEWSQGEQDRKFHEELLTHTNGMLGLPQFYVVEADQQLVGCYALLLNDINSRQDLFPWFAYLYVKPTHRGQGIAHRLLEHAEKQTVKLGFTTLYLESNHTNFYENMDYQVLDVTHDPFGNAAKIYYKVLCESV